LKKRKPNAGSVDTRLLPSSLDTLPSPEVMALAGDATEQLEHYQNGWPNFNQKKSDPMRR
jgi:hypothetical protein